MVGPDDIAFQFSLSKFKKIYAWHFKFNLQVLDTTMKSIAAWRFACFIIINSPPVKWKGAGPELIEVTQAC